jgi:acyl-CoA thioester hydrolase
LKLKAYVQPNPEGWLNKFHFAIPIKPRYVETDMFGHINNISYFIYFEQGRVDYLEHLQLAEKLFNDVTASVVGDLECQYLSQVYKKDPLRLHVRCAKLGRSSYDLEYALVEAVTGELKATGRGAMVFIDRQSGRSTPIPDDVREAIIAFEGPDLAV